DIWGVDPEGIVVDKEGNFYVSEENGPTIWKLNQNGVVIKRYSPYANLAGAQTLDVQIDTIFKTRKNNRGFESMAIAPNGKIYTMIQSPLLNPTQAIGENTRIHRILEIDPATNTQRMLVYLNDGVIGAAGANQIRRSDWKIGDMAAINDSTFLVIEAALRGTTDIKRIYKININNATAVNSGLYGGQSLEALADSAGLAFQGITPVSKTLFMDALANGWPSALEKIEGIAIVNDSTVAIINDNDYGQVSPAQNGIATATNALSHLFSYRLQGTNKLTNYNALVPTISQGVTALNSSQAPYLTPTITGVQYTALITAGDLVNGYKMIGIPDGLGAFDNNNGTFTMVSNHELGNTSGIARAHGSTGAFVSKWVINKSDLSIVSGADLIQNVKLWNPGTSSYITYNSTTPSPLAALGRFCSADLAPVSAFYNPATGKGTLERIFMNGEETGNEGRALGHIVTGAAAGTTYELMALGKASFENQVASPTVSDTTVVIGLDDATPGQIYVYVGLKQDNGTDIDKAGLNNGRLYGVSVSGLLTETGASVPAANTTFTLADLGNVSNITGTTLNTNSNNAGVTTFLRPEDGAWDPSNLNDFYFATTNAFNSPSRLWKLHFNNVANPVSGGTITAVLDGTEGQQMLDNITIDHSGHILMVEDVGGNAHIGKIWQYDIATDAFTQIARHDTTRFLTGSANFLTQDEEATGILDVQEILGPGMFITSDQAHFGVAGDQVEGGQYMVFNNPATAATNPEINLTGNSNSIGNNDMTPALTDNTDFGTVNVGMTKVDSFVIQNTGAGNLSISSIRLMGGNAAEFTLTGTQTYPIIIAANSSMTIGVKFAPTVVGDRTTNLYIANNDYNETVYAVALKGNAGIPEINVKGNDINIADGDATPGTANNTDFGTTTVNGAITKSFVIQNTGVGKLNVSAINVTGANASEFTLVTPPAFPMSIDANASQTVSMKFTP
ncbi:MAG: choice-of-anchor D domain-containing protein, partial [Sphingobacteriales bacterium]